MYSWSAADHVDKGRKPMTRSDSATNSADAAAPMTGTLFQKPRGPLENKGPRPRPLETSSKTVLRPRPSDHEFSLVIPAYNEEGRLPWTLAELRRFLDASGIDYRVLVADDGSTDRTATLAEKAGPRFSTVSLPQNRGKGAAVPKRHAPRHRQRPGLHGCRSAVRTGIASTGLRPGPQRDGARLSSAPATWPNRPIGPSASCRGRIATWLFREVVKRLVSREITDTQCGLKAFSLRAAREIFSRLTLDGFSFDAEVVFLTQRLGLPFQRIPVNLVREYGSTLSLRRHTIPMLRDIVGLWWRNRHLQSLPLELPPPASEYLEPAAAPTTRRPPDYDECRHDNAATMARPEVAAVMLARKPHFGPPDRLARRRPGHEPGSQRRNFSGIRRGSAHQHVASEQRSRCCAGVGWLAAVGIAAPARQPGIECTAGAVARSGPAVRPRHPLESDPGPAAERRALSGRVARCRRVFSRDFRPFQADGHHVPMVVVGGEAMAAAIEEELTCQVQFMLDRGQRPTHLNGHQYIEMLPAAGRVVESLLEKFRIPVVRVAWEPSWRQSFLWPGIGTSQWLIGGLKKLYAGPLPTQECWPARSSLPTRSSAR